MEGHPSGKWGFFEALMASVSEKANLMDPGSWTITVRQKFPTKAEAVGQHWLESNVIAGRDGKLVNFLRVYNTEQVAILKNVQ